MAATIRPPDTRGGAWLERFDWLERTVHWVNAVLLLVLVFTGAALYLQPLGELVGRRALVEDIHVYSGVALPIPLLLAVAGPWGRNLRADLSRFNRWSGQDRLWLRAVLQDRARRQAMHAELELGKFNAGQKLNAAWTAGAGLVMLGTGVIMRWYHPWPLSWRTGATFVHDWIALSIGVVVIGHIWMAVRDPDALASMFHGRIRRVWAERHAPSWLEEADGPAQAAPSTSRRHSSSIDTATATSSAVTESGGEMRKTLP